MKQLRLVCLILSLMLLWGCGTGEQTHVPDSNGDGRLTCTLEIRCDTLLTQLNQLPPEKRELVPADGILLTETEADFTAGDTVFHVFRQLLRENTIHFEYTDASAYQSVYIEGIGNLYEYDCGPQSGWMYSVNGVFPGLGCSSYTLSDGDRIVFQYTCDLGADLGGEITHEP